MTEVQQSLLDRIAKMKQEIAVLDGEYAVMKGDLDIIQLSSVWQYFQDEGRRLPKLLQDRTTRGLPKNPKHLPIQLAKLTEFKLLAIPTGELNFLRRVRASVEFVDQLRYSTEADVQLHCKSFLSDMIKAAQLSAMLTLRCDLQIAELKADFLVISHRGIPVGAVNVKKPGELASEVNYGQLFDYMLRIRSFHGLRTVFGILTNFEKWIICWLPDTDTAAQAANLHYNLESVTNPVVDRILHVSKQYSNEGSELAFAMYSVLKKMYKSIESTDPVPFVSSTRT